MLQLLGGQLLPHQRRPQLPGPPICWVRRVTNLNDQMRRRSLHEYIESNITGVQERDGEAFWLLSQLGVQRFVCFGLLKARKIPLHWLASLVYCLYLSPSSNRLGLPSARESLSTVLRFITHLSYLDGRCCQDALPMANNNKQAHRMVRCPKRRYLAMRSPF